MSSNSSPLVSIIMPAYNSASFVKETIASVLKQDFPNWELIIIDDGSTDDTASIVKDVDPRIRLLRQKNAGIAAARNTGLKISKGELISFLDHDDLWHPKKLSSQIRALAEHTEVGIVYGLFTRWNPEYPPVFESADIDTSLIDRKHSGWIYHLLLLTNWVLFSTAIFRREVFDKIGLFDTALPPADDWDMALRASRHFQFLMLAQPVALYRVHPNQTSKRVTQKNHEAELRDNAILLYGLDGPDGTRADSGEISHRQYKAHFNHGIQHLESGSIYIARQSLIKALRIRPFALKAWIKLAYSYAAARRQ